MNIVFILILLSVIEFMCMEKMLSVVVHNVFTFFSNAITSSF